MSKVTTFSLVQKLYFPFYVIAIAMALVKRKISDIAIAMDLRFVIANIDVSEIGPWSVSATYSGTWSYHFAFTWTPHFLHRSQ